MDTSVFTEWENKLEKSNFDLEEWKKKFNKSKDKKAEMKWFWENFDEKGYAIYSCSFSPPENQSFKNKTEALTVVSQFLQNLSRLKLNKFSFGSFLVLGEESLSIRGIFLFRDALQLPPHFQFLPDSNLFPFTKLDLSTLEQKTLVENYWCLLLSSIEGLSFDGKSFKFFK